MHLEVSVYEIKGKEIVNDLADNTGSVFVCGAVILTTLTQPYMNS